MDVRERIAGCPDIAPEMRVAVAVSGGPDSVVLLDALCVSGFDCVVAHCNFHLRGEASDGDAEFVERLAERYGVRFCRADFDTVGVARERGVSIEMAARDLRYEWFERVADECGCDVIAVAHNANDVVETFFLNLVRGTGLTGLTGMAQRRGRVVRPMLGVERGEVMEYVRVRGLEYRVDETNGDTVYKRNKIRHEVLPRLGELNPAFLSTMRDNMAHLRWAAEIVEGYAEWARGVCVSEREGVVCVDMKRARECRGMGLLMYEWLRGYGFTPRQIVQMSEGGGERSGRRFVSETCTAVINRNVLEIYENKEGVDEGEYVVDVESGEVRVPVHLRWEVVTPQQMSVVRGDASVAYFDFDKITGRLALRRWRSGDRMVPYGMRGRKRVSDVLTERGLSVERKRRVWILDMDGEVLWVVGVRADDRYKVTGETVRVLKVIYTE